MSNTGRSKTNSNQYSNQYLEEEEESIYDEDTLKEELLQKESEKTGNELIEDLLVTEYQEYQGANSYQFRALFRKMISLQMKQKGTNLCQVCTPILSLAFVLIIKQLLVSYLPTKAEILIDMPEPLNVDVLAQRFLNSSTCLEWFLYDFENETDDATKQFVGYNTGLPLIRPNESGLFGEMLTSACFKYNRQVPYVQRPNKTINEDIYEALKKLNKENFTWNEDMPGNQILPDGAITFTSASAKGMNFTLQVNDVRSPEYHRNNGFTKIKTKNKTVKFLDEDYPILQVSVGMLSLLDIVTRSFLRTVTKDYFVITATQQMPTVIVANQQITRLLNLTGSTLFPLALSLLLPIFMYSIVLEKEEKLISFMKMNGMQMWKYWVTNFLFDLLVYTIMVIIFFLFGIWIINITYFYQTSWTLQLLIYGGWGLGQISLSFFWAAFLSQAKTASSKIYQHIVNCFLVVGYILAMFLTIVAATLNAVLWTKVGSYPQWMNLYPAFSFSRAVYNCTAACGDLLCYETLSKVDSETWIAIIYQYVMGVIYLILGTYFHETIKQEYGVQKKWNFFCDWCKSTQQTVMIRDRAKSKVVLDDEDDDCIKEREKVSDLESTEGIPLAVKDMRQVYPAQAGGKPNVAVKNMNLLIERGETFGLLGPNGAGKTTLISMLTGLYPPNNGNAWIGQYDVLNNLRHVQRRIGVCPQFNILWGELTIEEHLYFFARLKGITPEHEEAKVKKAIEEVGLTKFSEYKANQLSGGMKRRLSIAISLVGEPDIIFLDEPSTGLDPKHRRQVWDILTQEEFRENRTLLITTHSMEEADVLCSRIGIMTSGCLRCIGTTLHLKNKYGGGYHLFVNCRKDVDTIEELHQIQQNVKDYVKQILPQSTLAEDNNGNFTFKIPLEGIQISSLFDQIESQKERLGISDWGISQCTLEDVFLRVVEKYSPEMDVNVSDENLNEY